MVPIIRWGEGSGLVSRVIRCGEGLDLGLVKDEGVKWMGLKVGPPMRFSHRMVAWGIGRWD